MNRAVTFRPEAEEDVRQAHRWYADISAALGEQFLSAVDAALALASNNPLAFQLAHRSLRRVLLRRFPYALFYVAGEDAITLSEFSINRVIRELLSAENEASRSAA